MLAWYWFLDVPTAYWHCIEVLLLWSKCDWFDGLTLYLGWLLLQWCNGIAFDVLALNHSLKLHLGRWHIIHWGWIWQPDNHSLDGNCCNHSFSLLRLKWLRCCIWLVDVTMTYWSADASDIIVAVKEKKTFILTSILAPLKNLKYIHCWTALCLTRSFGHRNLIKSWIRRKAIHYTIRQKQCASLIAVGPWTYCMLNLILLTILILQYWCSIAVVDICPADILKVN